MRAPVAMGESAAEAAIGAACRALHLPTVRAEAATLADTAAKERLTHRAYLAEVLSAEVDERDGRRRARRLLEARFPRLKSSARRRRDQQCVPCGAPGGWWPAWPPYQLCAVSR